MRLAVIALMGLVPCAYAEEPQIDPIYAAMSAATRELPPAPMNKMRAFGDILVEHEGRAGDGAHFFVTKRVDAKFPTLAERAQFAAQARPVLETLKRLVPDGTVRVRSQPNNREFVVFNNFTQDEGAVAVFIQAPDWASLEKGAPQFMSKTDTCPINVNLVPGNGLPAQWVGQEASAGGQAAGTNGHWYEYESLWVVIAGPAGTMMWTGNGGTCTQIADPTPPPPTSSGGTGSSGTGAGSGGGGVPVGYNPDEPGWACGPDAGVGVVCHPT